MSPLIAAPHRLIGRALDYFLDLSRLPSSQDQLDLDPQRRISLYFVVASSHRDGKCFVQLKISPFKSKYSDFRYHYYSIHASFAGEQTERQPENLKVAESIQQAYDSVNFRPCKYPFKFGQDEFVSQTPSTR